MHQLGSRPAISWNHGRTPRHLFIDFPKYVNAVDGSKRTTTQPQGTSGGPVFYLGDFNNPGTYRENSNFQPTLEAIIIEKPNRAPVLIAVRIGTIIQSLQKAGHFRA
jgi:hypothetical protein